MVVEFYEFDNKWKWSAQVFEQRVSERRGLSAAGRGAQDAKVAALSSAAQFLLFQEQAQLHHAASQHVG